MCGEKILVKTRDVSLTLVSFGAICSNLWLEIWKTDPFLKFVFRHDDVKNAKNHQKVIK